MNELIPNVTVPTGKSGCWSVERFAIKSDATLSIFNMRAGRRSVRPGKYTRLMRGGEVIMSDTDAEKSDHYCAVRAAKGAVLINGLGIGMVLNACMLKREVERAIVVEKSPDVMALCADFYRELYGNRVEIIEADAFEYRPPKGIRFGMVWHDVWDSICADNLPDMHRLHRKYGRITDWQGSWCRYECEASERRWR